jgi:hypothetical protein
LSRQEPLHADKPEGFKEKEPEIPEERKHVRKDKEVSPEGWKGDEPEEVRRAHITGGTEHLTSQVMKETIQTGMKIKKIPDLFRSQERKNLYRDMDGLRREERMEMKKRLEYTWKENKTHYDHLRWAN